MARNVSAQEIYAILKPFQLTEEQRSAVENAPTDSPSLVVAGAGSGKTELMSVRVLWLVANGHARPDQILGLTFTRKAASELSKRIYKALVKMRESELWPEGLDKEFAQPAVTTYNSYANSLFRQNALGLGLEQESNLLTDAAAFQLAREVVVKYGADVDPRLLDLDINIDSLVKKVISLAGEMNDNLVSANQVTSVIDETLNRITGLPRKPGSSDFSELGYYSDYTSPLFQTGILANLAQAYRDEKFKQGYVDYSDQVSLAERAVREIAGVRESQRAQYTQVLLDEYQDTSFLQTSMLSKLFAGTSVFAVGDPNQSIYGWRGASASNLATFGDDFEAVTDATGMPHHFELSTSWRNPTSVLTLANHLSKDLAVQPTYLVGRSHHLVPLTLRAMDQAQPGSVEVKVDQTIEDEAKSVALWLAYNLKKGRADGVETPTAAVLMRGKKQMQMFRQAIEDQGLAAQVVGIGGLLEMAEIEDLVAALKVIHSPSSGSELVRLLTGARWRIGPKDIDRLFRFAKAQNRFHLKDESVAPEDSVSIVDALDLLLDEKESQHCKVSDLGLARMQEAARLFANLRSQTGLPLVDFVRLVEKELWLDVEVMANPRVKNPMAQLNAFANVVAGYAASNHRPHLGAFLKWLQYADEKEKLETPVAAPEAGVVQLLTVHSAKGLEWDFVAVANLAEGDFPSVGKEGSHWIIAGKLPFPLRGDQSSLPEWNLSGIDSQQNLKKSAEAFKDEMKRHVLREEMRLIYVAVTRPKQKLLLSGSYWKPDIKKPKGLSSYLHAAAELSDDIVQVHERQEDLGDGVLVSCASDENPLTLEAETQIWPLDPLGPSHGAALSFAAEAVQNALLTDLGRVEADEIDLLLREREMRALRNTEVQLPVRINASGFKDYLVNTNQTADKMLRPLPQKPFKATRAGTVFHSLMEQRNAELSNGLAENPELDIADASERLWAIQLDSEDLASYELTLEQLSQNFASTKWARQIAVEAEVEIQLALDANIFICKIDAVFQDGDDHFEIVDWKTGAAPADADELEQRSLQLSLYRVAFATLRNLPLESVSACFYYVADNRVIEPNKLLTVEQIRQAWAKVPEARET